MARRQMCAAYGETLADILLGKGFIGAGQPALGLGALADQFGIHACHQACQRQSAVELFLTVADVFDTFDTPDVLVFIGFENADRGADCQHGLFEKRHGLIGNGDGDGFECRSVSSGCAHETCSTKWAMMRFSPAFSKLI